MPTTIAIMNVCSVLKCVYFYSELKKKFYATRKSVKKQGNDQNICVYDIL